MAVPKGFKFKLMLKLLDIIKIKETSDTIY